MSACLDRAGSEPGRSPAGTALDRANLLCARVRVNLMRIEAEPHRVLRNFWLVLRNEMMLRQASRLLDSYWYLPGAQEEPVDPVRV